MAKKTKSWQEKLADSKDLPKVVKIKPKMVGRWEAKSETKENTTPYWRTLKLGGVINEKYPLEKEGHRVILKGKKAIIADFEKSLVKI